MDDEGGFMEELHAVWWYWRLVGLEFGWQFDNASWMSLVLGHVEGTGGNVSMMSCHLAADSASWPNNTLVNLGELFPLYLSSAT